MISRCVNLCSVFLLFLVLPMAQAQEGRGQLLGKVTDPSGAAVSDAVASVKNIDTGVVTKATTNATGDYILPFLLPGSYELSVTYDAFAPYSRTNILVGADDKIEIDVPLSLATASSDVTVEAGAPLIETANATLSSTMDERRVSELPVLNGNSLGLAFLSPGVTSTTPNIFAQVEATLSGVANFSAIGVNNSNTFALDGAPNVQRNGVAYAPPTGTVQTFRVTTAGYDAAIGFTPGAVVDYTLKSGTNALHASAQFFYQNPVLNANNYFFNLSHTPRASVGMKRWQEVATGPVVIPKLYNGSDRTFWMFANEGFAEHDPRSNQTFSVPTPAERTGDFSALLAIGPQYQLYDPTSTQSAGNGRYKRSPFANNILPPARLSATALKLLTYYPQPNLPGNVDGSNNYNTPNTETSNYETYLARIDHNFSNSDRGFVRANMFTYKQHFPAGIPIVTDADFARRNKAIEVDEIHVFNSSIFVDSRYSWSHFTEATQPGQVGFDLQGAGFSPTLISEAQSSNPDCVRLPYMVPQYFGTFAPSGCSRFAFDVQSIASALTWQIRSHTLKFGFDSRFFHQSSSASGNSSGYMTFAGTYLRGPLDNSTAAPLGQGLAALELGLPDGGGLDINSKYSERNWDTALYIQDDWKITPKLTFSAGLRWELETPTIEDNNQTQIGFDFTSTNPLAATAVPAYAAHPISQIPASKFQVLGGPLFAAVGKNPNGIIPFNLTNLMPRVGFTYQLYPNVVLRGGAGLFYDQLGLMRNSVVQTGFSRTTTLVTTVNNGQTYQASLSNPFPTGIQQPTGNTAGLLTGAGQAVTALSQNLKTPYSERFSLEMQTQLYRTARLSIGYVGNRGVRLLIARNVNPIPNQYLSTSPTRDQTTINALSAQVANPFYPNLPGTSLSGTTVSTSQLLRPYPEFTTITQNTNQGHSWYNSLQVAFMQRMSRSFTLNASYTWSKFMDAVSYLNDGDASPERNVDDYDRPNRLTGTGIFELPFGQGKTIGANVTGLTRILISGWQAQAIYQFQTGQALGFGNAILYTDPCQAVLPSSQRTRLQYFDKAAFNTVSTEQLTSNVITLHSRFSCVRAPAINEWALSAVKNTLIHGKYRLQFRVEADNAFNHTVFSPPNTSPSSSAFGTSTGTLQNARTAQVSAKISF